MEKQNKEQQKKLLTEIMEADQKNGLYDISDEQTNMTAVEWLAKELENYGNPQACEINWEILDAFINKAKQMEKEQISEAWNDGNLVGRNGLVVLDYSTGKEYYNETYTKSLNK